VSVRIYSRETNLDKTGAGSTLEEALRRARAGVREPK